GAPVSSPATRRRRAAAAPSAERTAGEDTGAPPSHALNLPARGRVIVGTDQDLARLRTLRWTDDAVRFHDLDQPRRAGVSELQPPLQVRRARLPGAENHPHRVVVLRIVQVLDAVRAGLLLHRLRDVLDELR